MKNFIEDVAHKLGLELEQKFCIKHYRGHLLNDWETEAILVFKFTKDQGLVCVSSNNNMYQANSYLSDLILNRYVVIPYEKGCEIPKKDPELKKIYEYWDDIHGELHGYINTNWLENKSPFCTNDEKNDMYIALYNELMNTDKQLENILALPIFKEVRENKK